MRTLLMAVLLVVLCACAQRGHSDGPDLAGGSAPGWTKVTGSPLSERDGPVIAYVGGDVVLVGGYAGPACPPSASCAKVAEPERDGAAYSTRTGAWRSIAAAPRPVPEWAASAVAGQRLYVLVDRDLLVWNSRDDSWRTMAVPGPESASALVVDGTRLVLPSGSDEHGGQPDLVLDTVTGEWSRLPANPLVPSFDRTITATSAGLVLTGLPMNAHGDPEDPALAHAAVLARGAHSWRELPAGDQLGTGPWTWTGTRMVDPTLGGGDGGEINNYGRTIPYGGRLDPTSGAWTPLLNAPGARSGGWPVTALAGPMIASSGWLYEDATGTWTRLPRPHDAPGEPGPATWTAAGLVVYGGGTWHGETYDRSSMLWLFVS